MDSERGVGCRSSHGDKRGDRDQDATRTGNSTRRAGRKGFWTRESIYDISRAGRGAVREKAACRAHRSRAPRRDFARALGE